MEVIYVPEKIADKIKRRGLDIQELVLDMLAEILELDPVEISEARLELAEKYLEEAKRYIEKDDPVKTSKKSYKVTEECVKALAYLLNAPGLEEVARRDRWTTWLLGNVARTLFEELREPKIVYVELSIRYTRMGIP